MTQPGPNDPQLIEVSLASGLDESTDDAMTPATKCRLANNIVFPDTQTAAKRQGLTVVHGPFFSRLFAHDSEILGINPDSSRASAWVPSQSTLEDRGPVSPCMLSRALLAAGNTPVANSPTPAGTAFNKTVIPFGSVGQDPTTGLRVYAWSNAGTICASIWDTNAEAYVITAAVLAPGAGDNSGFPINQPRVVLAGSVAFVLFWDQTSAFSSFVQYVGIDLTNIAGGWSAEGSTGCLVDDANGCFDACTCYVGSTPGSAVPYVALAAATNTSGQTSITVLEPIGTLLGSPGGTVINSWTPGVNRVDAIGCAATPIGDAPNNQVAVSYGQYATTTASLTWSVFTPLSGFVPTTLYGVSSLQSNTVSTTATGPGRYWAVGLVATDSIGSSPGAKQQWNIVFTRDYRVSSTIFAGGALSGTYINTSLYSRAQASDSSSGTTYGPTLGYQTLSKPIVKDPVHSGAQKTYVLAVTQDGARNNFNQAIPTAPVTKAPVTQTLVLLEIPTEYGGIAWANRIPAAVAAPGFAGPGVPLTMDAAYLTGTANGFVMIGTEEGDDEITSITALTCDFASPQLWQSVRLGPWTYLAGGLPMLYDGSALTEVGFVNAPPQPVVSLPGAGSSILPAITTLTYQVCYAQQDAQGNTHRSPASIAAIVDASAGYPEADIAIQTLNVTLREQRINATVDTVNPVRIELYRNNSTQATPQLLAVLANDPAYPVLTYTDSATDGGNLSAPVLYTIGIPAAEPFPCPNLSALAIHAERLWGISEDGQTAFFSTVLTRGEAPYFADAFTITWPENTITAQWSLENRLHAATTQKTFFVFGQGPANDGSQNDLTNPDIWQSYLGVIDARGVCLFQGGAVLNTGRGVYVEDRTGNFTWLGWRFQRTYDANPVVTGMCALDESGCVRIALQTEGGNTSFGSPVIHWDYWNDKIATHSQNPQTGIVSVANAGGTYWALANSGGGVEGSLIYEDPTTNFDGGSGWVTQAIEVGWAHPQGVQGYARMKLAMVLGYQNTPAGVNLQVARDYAAHFDSAEGAWQDFQIAASTNAPTFQLQFRPATEKCEAVSFLVNDVSPGTLPAGTGQGPTFKALLMRWALKQGQYKRLGSTYTE